MRRTLPRAIAVLVVGLSAPGFPPALQAQVGVLAMERAAERYASTRTLCADFDQVIEITLVGKTVASKGRLCQQRPNFFSMRFTSPNGDLALSDGDYFWTYYPSMTPEQAIRVPLTQSPGGYDFYGEFLDDPDSKYAIEDVGIETIGNKDCLLVKLTPVRQAAYRRARVWLDPETDLLCQVEVVHENQSVRTVTLRNVTLNPRLDAGEFIFVKPDGVRIIDPPS